ncbi:hypothetical protein [Arthrobacter psychrochitiniphilus]|uniref:hypothetical protein n=1 Tax=Arthrobacter psychrochitiniphilus TaxID=291045 RepID=UPI003F7C6581
MSAIVDHAQPAGSGSRRHDLAATNGVRKVFHAAPNGVALDSQAIYKAVIIMGPRASKTYEAFGTTTAEYSLIRPPEYDIPTDQLMRAVEGVRPYVKIHLGRFGLSDDVDDVLQDIRFAAWRGAIRGSYQAVPGVKFDAWVQGIACNLCAHHARRSIARSTVPLDERFESKVNEVMDIQMTRLEEQSINHIWVIEILQLVKTHVPERTWELALASLSDWKDQSAVAMTKDASTRTRWHAIFVVRQMALTISHALDVEPQQIVDLAALRTATVAALPTPLFQLIARDIVMPAVLRKTRAAAVSGVAEEAGVSVRYVKVQIGLVRDLVLAAEEILRAGTSLAGTVIETPTALMDHTVSKA